MVLLYKEPSVQPSNVPHNTSNFRNPKNKMMKLGITHFLLCSSFLLLILNSTAHEVDDEREFDYDEKSGKGPAQWGELHPEWSLCKNGSMQSPIDLLDERVEVVSHLGRLKRSYNPSNATITNRGHDMMLKWEGYAGYIEINGTQYELKQCHWHSPSEHTIDGQRFDMEAHMVHESSDGKIAVVGIIYKLGRPDSFLSSLMDHLAAITDTGEAVSAAGIVNPKNIKIGSIKYYRYIGSLTTPPCTQNVVWTIVKKVRTVSLEQTRLLRVAVHDDSNTNARPLQPINRRSVYLYRPSEGKKD